MKKWIMLTVAVGVVALAAIAYAQSPRPDMRDPRGDRPFTPDRLLENQELIQDLDLEEEQVAALKEARREAQKASIELRAQQELAEIDLRTQLESEEPDAEAVMDAIERAGHARTEMKKQQVRVMLETRSILGPETWKELQERMRTHMRERAEQRRERMGDMEPRPRLDRGGDDGDRPFREGLPERPRWEEGRPPRER